MLVLTVGLSGTVIGILADDDDLHSPKGSKVGPGVDVLSCRRLCKLRYESDVEEIVDAVTHAKDRS